MWMAFFISGVQWLWRWIRVGMVVEGREGVLDVMSEGLHPLYSVFKLDMPVRLASVVLEVYYALGIYNGK